jgi:hypothetical protein
MTTKPESVRTAEAHGEGVVQSRGFEWFARAGLVARAAIYLIIGILALKLALPDSSGATTSQQGALQQIAQESFGEWLLIAMAFGLAGYATWRLARAAIGHGPEAGEDSAFDRVSGAVSGIAYGILCATAVSILVSSGSSGGSGGGSQTTGGVLGWPGGTWIVGIAGAIVIGVGLEQAYKGIGKKFLEKSKTEQMSPKVESAFTALGVAGHLARGVVFALMGYSLIKAAIDYNPKAEVSLDAALSKLAHADYGPWLLGIVSAGLIAFGLYALADARYRKV